MKFSVDRSLPIRSLLETATKDKPYSIPKRREKNSSDPLVSGGVFYRTSKRVVAAVKQLDPSGTPFRDYGVWPKNKVHLRLSIHNPKRATAFGQFVSRNDGRAGVVLGKLFDHGHRLVSRDTQRAEQNIARSDRKSVV